MRVRSKLQKRRKGEKERRRKCAFIPSSPTPLIPSSGGDFF